MKPMLRALAIASCLFPLSAIAGADDLSEGTVKKIDVPNRSVVLSHGPLVNLGMPGMTMSFRVKDPAMLQPLKAGAKVRFRAEEVGGALTVVRIEAAK